MQDIQPLRIWTLDEADAALPDVRAMLAQGRAAAATFHEAEAQTQDLRIVHGDDVRSEGHPAHGEWLRHREAMHRARREAVRVAQRFQARGIELKDLQAGLVDFPAMMGDRVVFLCWKDGEDRIRHWHPVETGFAGRQPVPDDPVEP